MPNAEMIEISVDGVSLKVGNDVKVTQIFAGQSVDMTGVGPDAIVVCKINGVLRDLWSDVAAGDVVEGISIASPEGLMVLRHSTAQ